MESSSFDQSSANFDMGSSDYNAFRASVMARLASLEQRQASIDQRLNQLLDIMIHRQMLQTPAGDERDRPLLPPPHSHNDPPPSAGFGASSSFGEPKLQPPPSREVRASPYGSLRDRSGFPSPGLAVPPSGHYGGMLPRTTMEEHTSPYGSMRNRIVPPSPVAIQPSGHYGEAPPNTTMAQKSPYGFMGDRSMPPSPRPLIPSFGYGDPSLLSAGLVPPSSRFPIPSPGYHVPTSPGFTPPQSAKSSAPSFVQLPLRPAKSNLGGKKGPASRKKKPVTNSENATMLPFALERIEFSFVKGQFQGKLCRCGKQLGLSECFRQGHWHWCAVHSNVFDIGSDNCGTVAECKRVCWEEVPNWEELVTYSRQAGLGSLGVQNLDGVLFPRRQA
ncbi:hypothetical protein CC80DRAFT_556584 [Byssothecium circinans]|uniref:Uncharacterized protein n=1 Tax=Byssothecium circinans TaxID=147558 RepID=A0A6A5T6G0_9PLEO|nr:hypothetical protein CC80DRAFT_556584 [Byssothecium circinans]